MTRSLAGLFSPDAVRGESRASSSPRASWRWAAVLVALFVAGTSHADGPVIAWGDETDGRVSPPASVDGTDGTASAIAAGDDHSCAIQAETGNVVCWGSDGYGRASPPASVDGTDGTASAIAAGDRHSCAIQADTGNVVCWGSDGYGQASPPASVDGTDGTASAIAAGVCRSIRSSRPEAVLADRPATGRWMGNQQAIRIPRQALRPLR